MSNGNWLNSRKKGLSLFVGGMFQIPFWDTNSFRTNSILLERLGTAKN